MRKKEKEKFKITDIWGTSYSQEMGRKNGNVRNKKIPPYDKKKIIRELYII